MQQLGNIYTLKFSSAALCMLGFAALAVSESPPVGRHLDLVVPGQTATAVNGDPQLAELDNTIAVRADGRKSFAFGYLEFDWDPAALGGLPGFDSWPG
jgi:hypothetical protein